MAQTVLTLCPTCGRRFDFPLTGCVTGVADMLLADSGGNCRDCGTRVVVDEPPPEYLPRNPFAEIRTPDDTRAIKIVNLDLSVRCRLTLTKMGAVTVGDLLDAGRQSVLEHVGESSVCAEQLLELFSENKVAW